MVRYSIAALFLLALMLAVGASAPEGTVCDAGISSFAAAAPLGVEDPIRESLRAALASAPTAVTPPAGDAAEASVNLYGQVTRTQVGGEIILTLSAIGPMGEPAMTVQLTLKVPSGMSVTSSGFSLGAAGMYTGTFAVQPGQLKAIDIHLVANQAGDFEIAGDVCHYFGQDSSSTECKTESLTISVYQNPENRTDMESAVNGIDGDGEDVSNAGDGGSGNWWTIIPIICGPIVAAVGITGLIVNLRRSRAK